MGSVCAGMYVFIVCWKKALLKISCKPIIFVTGKYKNPNKSILSCCTCISKVFVSLEWKEIISLVVKVSERMWNNFKFTDRHLPSARKFWPNSSLPWSLRGNSYKQDWSAAAPSHKPHHEDTEARTHHDLGSTHVAKVVPKAPCVAKWSKPRAHTAPSCQVSSASCHLKLHLNLSMLSKMTGYYCVGSTLWVCLILTTRLRWQEYHRPPPSASVSQWTHHTLRTS